jgi:carbon-monoxide dehydrogenase large subunit
VTVNVTTFPAGSLVGAPVRRVEDPDLVTGRGTYIDNLSIDGMLELAFVRSTVAHARLELVDTSEARGMPGVAGVYAAGDLDVPEYFQFMKLNPAVTRPALAQDRVRFVGDIVAVVAAETRAQAADAAEAVVVEYDPLPAVADPDAALASNAPILFDELGSNVVSGGRGAPGDPLDDAEIVVRGRFENQRVAVVPMEGGAIAVVPGDDGLGHEVTLHLACQMPHMVRMLVAGMVGVEMDKLRVIAPHVGGSFGAKH